MLETGTAQVIVELAPRNAVAGSPSGGANSEGARTPVTSTAVLPDPREEEEGPDTASIAEAAPAQPDQETRTDADTAVVPDTAAEPDMTVEPGSLAPSSAGRQAGVTLPANPAAPAYTPQQPVLAQTAPQTPARVPAQTPVAQPARPGTAASQPSSSRVPAQASVTQPRQMAPQTLPASPGTASRSQSASVPPGSVPVASFQPIPTVTRPPATTGAAPIMPNSAMVTSIPSAPVQTQPQRNQPVYASAEIAGGPFVSGRYYRLQIGSYKVARNAVDVFDRLSAAGLNPQWEPYGDLYRVVISNVRAEDINTLAVRLGNAGFKEAIAREER
jgi:hypothetical protein